MGFMSTVIKHLHFRDNWLLCSGQRFWEIVAATIEERLRESTTKLNSSKGKLMDTEMSSTLNLKSIILPLPGTHFYDEPNLYILNSVEQGGPGATYISGEEDNTIIKPAIVIPLPGFLCLQIGCSE